MDEAVNADTHADRCALRALTQEHIPVAARAIVELLNEDEAEFLFNFQVKTVRL